MVYKAPPTPLKRGEGGCFFALFRSLGGATLSYSLLKSHHREGYDGETDCRECQYLRPEHINAIALEHNPAQNLYEPAQGIGTVDVLKNFRHIADGIHKTG